MNASVPKLTESVRIPLHELQADLEYLIGRVIADGSCGPLIVASIKNKLSAIEAALTTQEPVDRWTITSRRKLSERIYWAWSLLFSWPSRS